MITTLTATTTDRITSELLAAQGGALGSRVLTLLISTDTEGLEDALAAAHGASRDHPSRVIAVVAPPGPEDSSGPRSRDGHVSAELAGHLDADIRTGHDAGAGETLVLRPWGEAAEHVDTLVVPFLLPDVPVVVWWPGEAPLVPSEDPLGKLASTRITNTPACENPAEALAKLAPGYRRGDIDLAWTRLTLWRATVSASLGGVLGSVLSVGQADNERAAAGVAQPTGEGKAVDDDGAQVPDAQGAAGQGQRARIVLAGEASNASVALMERWLELRTGLEVVREDAPEAIGIERIVVEAPQGKWAITRTDGERVTLTAPGQVEPRVITMPRREPITTLTEELRRLSPDFVYEEVLAAFAASQGLPSLGEQIQAGIAEFLGQARQRAQQRREGSAR